MCIFSYINQWDSNNCGLICRLGTRLAPSHVINTSDTGATVKISIRASVFGASPSTGNQGVNALCWSLLSGLAQRGIDDVHVFDYRKNLSSERFGDLAYKLQPMTIGKRFWQENHLEKNRLAAALGKKSGGILGTVSQSDLVMDVSGGDSFTDLYGPARFRQIVAPKKIALALNRPLVLPPQTYGPFRNPRSRRIAKNLIGNAHLALARDPESFERMQDLLGDEFDPMRHQQGVDLAFGLPAVKPASIDSATSRFLARNSDRPLIGLNISGLLTNQESEARIRFGLKDSYIDLMHSLIKSLLNESDARILFIPHVHAPDSHFESDLAATRLLINTLPATYRKIILRRSHVLGDSLNACELKWYIAQCDWFSGARMHSTIAALSSGVPTAAIAYSPKVKGVFATCNQGDSVVDLRQQNLSQANNLLLDLWQQREECAANLADRLPEVLQTASRQLNAIAFTSSESWCGGRMVKC